MWRNPASILLAFLVALGLPACGGKDDNNPVVDSVDKDVDGDHIPNLLDNCPNDPNPGQENNDADPQGDVCDPDDDNDGVDDPADNCPMDANLDQADPDRDQLGSACDSDRDGDGAIDYCDFPSAPIGCIEGDNCPGVSNPRQVDSNHDGNGDACTRDCDDDGVANFENGHDETVQDCQELAVDFDGDGFRGLNDCREDNPAINIGAVEVCNGIDDDCDGVADEGLVNCQPFPLPDGDADGSPDPVDNCPLLRNEDQADRDHDSIGDVCDDDEAPPADCLDDEDCDDGEGCNVDGMCVEQCGNALCDVGEICQGQLCVPDLGNGNDSDDDLVPTRCADVPNSPPEGCEDDNCPDMPNPDQADRDDDGLGDACDGTNDLGCSDPALDCPQNGMECRQLDGDEPLECAWPDADGDGVPDQDDRCPGVQNLGTDLDNDGIDDACDQTDDRLCQNGGPNCLANDILICVDMQCVADEDNDGIPTECPLGAPGCINDNCPAVANLDQADNDNDDIGDACDACPNFNGPANSCGACAPQAEDVCDGLDNDCDGTTDEGFNVGHACTNGVGACAQAGVMVCNGQNASTCNAVPGQPVVETCNGQDDNCNGSIDETPDGPPLSRVCYTGPGGTQNVGVCHAGNQTCANGQWGVCAGQVVPAAETCEGTDENCNGPIDETFVDLGTQCTVGVGACSRTGERVCNLAGNGLECSAQPGSPVAEVCDDNIDNNCDGQTNENCPGDTDGDGHPDGADNCPQLANANQLDTDADGLGDVCDNCPNTPNPNQANFDSNPARGDACFVQVEARPVEETGRPHYIYDGADQPGRGPKYFTQLGACEWGMDIAVEVGQTGAYYGCNVGAPALNTVSVLVNGVQIPTVLAPRPQACGGNGSNIAITMAQLGCPGQAN